MRADKIIKFTLQITGLILINKAGFYIVELFELRIPGNVLGMILLFVLLWTRVVRLEWFEGAADFLVRHLSFFFVPISVGLMTLGGLIAENGIQLAVILFISAIIGMVFAGGTSHMLIKRKGGKETGNSADDL
ncbi:CidA/LrgA family protein [Mesobacillus subterraneus]|uniref:CidA/LrgA family protein n=1 Tax=Mesobacillus subterraneus TaxID=285983 RepID=UPI001CFC9082|nr:CidA/LrgA family protein [Mesobacillus subterraneus]WLR56819.1 CidA/LrgA family protein [Mesobacillus subterraneus]